MSVIQLDHQNVKRLLMGVLAQAIRDAARKDDTPTRREARDWLHVEGVELAARIGINLTGDMLTAWANEGYPGAIEAKRKRGEYQPLKAK